MKAEKRTDGCCGGFASFLGKKTHQNKEQKIYKKHI